jgi:hypothetical protein
MNTTATSSASTLPLPQRKRWSITCGGPALAFVLVFGLPLPRRRLRWMLILLSIVTAAGVTGCGGGSNSGSSSHSSTPATTAGSYTFSVTAIDAANSNIAASTKVTLTVQ